MMITLTFVWIALSAGYVAKGESGVRSNDKCQAWAKKFRRCLNQGYESTHFQDCETGMKKSTQPYCPRWENYLNSNRCQDYDCPKAHPDCEISTEHCLLDPNCKTKLEIYQVECAQMKNKNMTSCTESCFKAYHRLRNDGHGAVLVEQQCDQLEVKNVRYSCISQPASRLCVRSVERCSEECKELVDDLGNKCLIGFVDAACSDECREAYTTIVNHADASELLRDCQDVNTILKVKCFE